MSGFDEKKLFEKHRELEPDLKPPEAHQSLPGYKVGNSYIDRGMQCDAVPADTCFLNPGQRSRIVDLFHGRVLDARQSYMHACEQLRVGELLAKEPSPGLLFEVFLEVVGLVALGGLSSALRNVVAFGKRVVEEAKLAEQDPDPLMQSLSKINTKQTEQVGKSVVSMAKKHAAKSAPPEGEDKIGVRFLEELQNQSGPIYQDIRENAPALMDDSELLLLFDSFSAQNHTVEAYKEQLKGKLDRWKSTQLSDIGTRTEDKDIPCDVWIQNPTPQHITGYTVGPRDTKLFVVNTMGIKKLGVFRRQFKLAGNFEHVAAPAMIPPIKPSRPDLPRSPMVTMNDDDFKFIEFVPDEFVDIAYKAHMVAWGHTPTERTLVPWSKP